MARIGYQYLAGTPGAGKAQEFQSFLAANLTTWTVGPVYVFDSGTSERDYFTLTSNFGGEEILVTMPNGSTEDVASSLGNSVIYSTGDASTATDQTMALMFAIDGGFESRLIAGDDPNIDVDTFYPTRITAGVPFEFWFINAANNVFYIIEDEDNAAFFFYSGYEISNQGYSYWGYADNYLTFDVIPNVPAYDFNPNSVVHMNVANSTAASPRPTQSVSQWWHYTGQTERSVTEFDIDYSTPGFLDNLTVANQPNEVDGSFVSARTQFNNGGGMSVLVGVSSAAVYESFPYLGFIGQFNPAIHRQFGNIVDAYRRKLVSRTGDVFVHLHFSQLTPWAANLPNPL